MRYLFVYRAIFLSLAPDSPSFRPSFVSRGAGDVSRSYTPAPKSFRVSGATVKNIQNQLRPRARCGAFAKGDESGMYIPTVGSQLCPARSSRDLFIALHRETLVPLDYSLRTPSLSRGSFDDSCGPREKVVLAVTNYPNDRPPASNRRLISPKRLSMVALGLEVAGTLSFRGEPD